MTPEDYQYKIDILVSLADFPIRLVQTGEEEALVPLRRQLMIAHEKETGLGSAISQLEAFYQNAGIIQTSKGVELSPREAVLRDVKAAEEGLGKFDTTIFEDGPLPPPSKRGGYHSR